MAIWHSDGLRHSIAYWRVDPLTLENVGLVAEAMDGGRLRFDNLTALKANADVPFIGKWDIGQGYLRIITTTYAMDGRTESVEQGTFLTSVPRYQIEHGRESGTATMVSLLQLLDEQPVTGVLTVPAGTNAVDYAADLCRRRGLRVIADPSDHTLNVPAVFGDVADVEGNAEQTMLGVVNRLMTFAGFASATVNGHGDVELRRYVNPTNQAPTVVFADDVDQIVHTDPIQVEYDASSVPNRILATCSNADGYMEAEAINSDPSSGYSTVTRGRVITQVERVSDIASLQALQALADRRLVEVSTAIERTTFSHRFIPYRMGDAVLVRLGGFQRHIGTVSLDVTLDYTLDSTTTGRRFVR